MPPERRGPVAAPGGAPVTGLPGTAIVAAACVFPARGRREEPQRGEGGPAGTRGTTRAVLPCETGRGGSLVAFQANPIDGSSRKRRVMQEAPAPPARKRVAGAGASVSGLTRVDGGGVQQARDADPGEVAALRDASDRGDRTFLAFPPDKLHPARVFFRDLASLGENQPLHSAVVDLIAKLYISETQEEFLDGMLLFETRFFDLVLGGKWDEAVGVAHGGQGLGIHASCVFDACSRPLNATRRHVSRCPARRYAQLPHERHAYSSMLRVEI